MAGAQESARDCGPFCQEPAAPARSERFRPLLGAGLQPAREERVGGHLQDIELDAHFFHPEVLRHPENQRRRHIVPQQQPQEALSAQELLQRTLRQEGSAAQERVHHAGSDVLDQHSAQRRPLLPRRHRHRGAGHLRQLLRLPHHRAPPGRRKKLGWVERSADSGHQARRRLGDCSRDQQNRKPLQERHEGTAEVEEARDLLGAHSQAVPVAALAAAARPAVEEDEKV